MSEYSGLRSFIACCVLVILTLPAAAQSAAGNSEPAGADSGQEAASTDLPPEAFSGLYSGAIVYRPGGSEIEILVELGVDGEGKMTGTLDMLAYPSVTYKPLENFAIDGREVYFNYRHFSEIRGPDALFELKAELAEDGQRLDGAFLEQQGSIPFTLERIGDPGAPRPDLEPRPLADLAGADDLKQRLNAHPDHAHLVILLSPT